PAYFQACPAHSSTLGKQNRHTYEHKEAGKYMGRAARQRKRSRRNLLHGISSKNQQLCQRSDKRKYLARNNHVHTLSLLDACFCACPRSIPVNNTAYRTNSAHPSLWDTSPFRNNRLRLNAISP